MNMELGEFETEEVKIGNWQSRLPSDICTNRQVFNEIFSLDTWNNVLKQDQKDRLIKMLPTEVSSNVEATNKTIEELFNGSLSLFSINPLGNFFGKLESGQYDPVVTDMKVNIKRELKKESLRQLKNYHTRLLEDIVVSRQRHLTRLKTNVIPLTSNNNSKAPKTAKGKNAPKSKNNKQPGIGVLQNASSELNSGKLPAPVKPKPAQAVQKPVISRAAEENDRGSHPIAPASKKRKGKEDPSDNIDSGKPAAKKPAYSNKKPTTNIPGADKRGGNINKMGTSQIESKKPVLTIVSKTENSSPSVPPIHQEKPLIVVTTPQPRFFIQGSTDSILNAALTGDKNSKTSNFVGTTSGTYTSPSKSSPILASQLQASPQVSVKVDDTLGFFNNEAESESSCRITLNYQKIEEKSSDDDLETSSDEFEAIQATFGFGTSPPTLTMTGKEMLSPRNQTISSSSVNVTTSTPFASRIIQVHPQHPQESHSFISVTVSSSASKSTTSNPMYIVSTTSLEGRQQQGRILQLTTTDSMKHPLTSQQLALMSSPKILVKGGGTDQQFLQKIAGQSQEVIRISNSDLLNANASGGIHYTTSTGKNLLLHPINTNVHSSLLKTTSSSGHQLIQQEPSFANLNLSASSSMQFVTSSASQQLKANESLSSLNSSSSLMESDELNLSLGSLGSLGLGMNVSGMSNISVGSLEGMMENEHMKLEMDSMDKIDDLSVLDGNPFDSIPNLSDELDGLDLDLVEGLCDFEGLLSDEKKYPSFFSLIRDVLCSTRDHRMNLLCLEKTVKKWTTSSGATLNLWFLRVADWNNALMTALNFLAGTYQDVHPEDFVPYIEYKYKTKYYQWIGAGRDGDNNLTPLCSIWMDNMEKLPSIKKLDGEAEDQEEEDEENEDSELTGEDAKKKNKRPITPPPPRCVTDWTVQPSSEDEKLLFRKQERSRFDNPHKAFTYNMHDYESVVGPVKGVYSSQVGMTNKARGHSLLVDDRPPYVTILALVRDAVARLPNGEGTRSEICEMLRDSTFLAPDASSVTLNSVVSGALDRLHYERDPCVRYDSHKKSWIYLHRDRTQEQFERLHHNRSYTKSTKNRNNNSRKSRRASAKASASSVSSVSTVTGIGSASSTSSSTTTFENSCAEDDQIILAPVSVGTTSSDSDNVYTSLPTQTHNNSSESVILSSSIPTSSTDFENTQVKLEPVEYPVEYSPPTATTSLQNIRFTSSPPDKTSSPIVNIVTTAESAGISPQQYLVQTSSSSILSAISQNSIQIQSTNPLQVQSLHNSSGVETVSSLSSPRPVSTTATTSQQGQVVFGPQTVLRLANALRFNQLRLSGASPASQRMPQHRILLTRGAVPGQGQTQGILLGQTASGQTVILSTQPGSLGSFQTLHSLTPTSSGLALQDSLSSMTVENSQASSMTTYSLKPVVSRPSNSTIIATSKTTSSSIGGLLKPTIATTSGSHPGIISLSMPSQTDYVTSTSSSFGNRQQLGSYTFATVRGNTMSLHNQVNRTTGIQLSPFGQNQIGHQTFVTSTGAAEYSEQNTINVSHNQPAMTSPIIIRSVQGDLMLPGHIALGKGVQGIKLFPFPMGNKTVLAKLLPPNPTPRMSTAVPATISNFTTGIPLTTSTSTATPNANSPSEAH